MSKRERISALIFLLLAFALLLGAWAIFDRKLACHYTYRVYGFFNEPEQSMDVIGYGSSRMYCTLDPLVLHHETGLRSYVLATEQQPLRATLHYMRESLKRQSPQLLVLEATMAFHPEETVSEAEKRDCIDPLPWSAGKTELIRSLIPAGQRSSYYFNFLKYHRRWKELSRQDFDFSFLRGRDPFRGYVCLTPAQGADCRARSYDGIEAVPIPEENLELLRRMAALAQENGAQLMLLAAPYEQVAEDLGYLKSLHAFCEAEGLPFLDLNLCYDELGLDGSRDYFDSGHFNLSGSTKATRYLSRFVEEHFAPDVSPHPLDTEYGTEYGRWAAVLSEP